MTPGLRKIIFSAYLIKHVPHSWRQLLVSQRQGHLAVRWHQETAAFQHPCPHFPAEQGSLCRKFQLSVIYKARAATGKFSGLHLSYWYRSSWCQSPLRNRPPLTIAERLQVTLKFGQSFVQKGYGRASMQHIRSALSIRKGCLGGGQHLTGS